MGRTVAQRQNYFFLPALGEYVYSGFYNEQTLGIYWSKASLSYDVLLGYTLSFSQNYVPFSWLTGVVGYNSFMGK